MARPRVNPPTGVTAMRLPITTLQEIEHAATQQGQRPGVLLKSIVLQWLENNSRTPEQRDAAVLQFEGGN